MNKRFELIVSNPPYAIHWDPESEAAKNDERFTPAGAFAPKTKADFAFIMHSLHLLKANGTAAIVVFPGILYRGGAEATIRQYLVNENVVDAVIQLPSKLFYGTSIATCILVLKKNRENNCRDTIFIDASKYSTKASKNDYLSDENIEDIYKLYADRKDVDHIAKVVSIEDIQKAEYNLSVSTYVEPEDTTEKIDIKALNAEIDQIVAKENELRAKIKEIIVRIEGAGNED
jgi:type I restriction enzyme M protein